MKRLLLPYRLQEKNTLSSLCEQTRGAGGKMPLYAPVLSRLPPHSTKVGKSQLFLASTICSHSRRLFPAVLELEFSVIVSTPSSLWPACAASNRNTEGENNTDPETQSGQTVNCTVPLNLLLIFSWAKSFEFCTQRFISWGLPASSTICSARWQCTAPQLRPQDNWTKWARGLCSLSKSFSCGVTVL